MQNDEHTATSFVNVNLLSIFSVLLSYIDSFKQIYNHQFFFDMIYELCDNNPQIIILKTNNFIS